MIEGHAIDSILLDSDDSCDLELSKNKGIHMARSYQKSK